MLVRRRELMAALGGAATWPLAVRAQQPTKMARLGYLAPASEPHLIPYQRHQIESENAWRIGR